MGPLTDRLLLRFRYPRHWERVLALDGKVEDHPRPRVQKHFQGQNLVNGMTSRLAGWLLSTCFKMAITDAEFCASLEINLSG